MHTDSVVYDGQPGQPSLVYTDSVVYDGQPGHPSLVHCGVSSGIFQLGGQASLASQILYLITTLGKSLTRPFPGIASKRSGRQDEDSEGAVREIYQCHSASHLHYWKGGDFGSLQAWEDPENLEGWDLIEAKTNIFNKKLKFLHCAVKII